MDEEQKPRKRSFISELVPDWRPTRAQVLWAVRIAIVLVGVLGILTLIGLPFGITLWEWVKLLIVPAVIAAGGLWFNRQQRDREMEIAEQRSQDEALQAYLDQMSQLLIDQVRPLRRAGPRDDLSIVARARTLTVLTRLEGERKGSVVRFLYESGLITKDRLIIDLQQSNLSGANLYRAHLYGANFRRANLRGADLSGAYLYGANLRRAYLYGASLSGAHLYGANLSGADLSSADLSSADLSSANLLNANVSDANLSLSDLSGADLTDAYLTQKQLDQAKSLEGATMPNGQKYEDWLKDNEGRGEEGENSGPL